ncbi:MAG TPA: BT_3928 family protein [Chitinophagaceae bacterium]
MRIIVNIARIIVGVLFIFSGLVKANDPLGLSYKMQEFFEVWGNYSALHSLMLWLNDYALAFSLITITLEVIVGVAILLGRGVRFFSWLLLLLIIFFTFLTGYAVLSGKIRTCGCFGDCIPLTAMQSFIKDIALFVLILIIFFGAKYIRPLFKGTLSFVIICVTLLLVVGFQWQVLKHMPLIDCLPYKKGNNILELRKMPADATFDKFSYKFIWEKNGEKKESPTQPDSTWNFVERKETLLEKGKNNEPPIKDFVLTVPVVPVIPVGKDSTKDVTDSILNQSGEYYFFFIKDATKDTTHWMENFRNLYSFAKEKNRPIIIIASQASVAQQFFNEKNNFNVPIVGCDATALKTAARTDPSLYLMKGPIVQHKWGWADIEKATR